MKALMVLLAVVAGGAGLAGTDHGFEDRTAAAGVSAPHQNRSFKNPYAEIMQGYTALGAAVAVADYDGDGFEDLFVTDSAETGRNHLYKNDGDFTFTDVAEKAGVAAGNDAVNATADALWFDYDNDGRPDLFVVRFGKSQLFHNQGKGRFEDVTKKSGLDVYANAITAVAFDYDRDGDLDLFVGNYFQKVNLFNPDTPRFFPESFETANNGGGLTVFRNEGKGRFTDVTRAAGIALSGWTLDLGHADFDHDGDEDLYVACDFGTDRLLVNNGDGTFSDVARETGVYDTGWGWGGKFFDYDNDGWLDLYVVNGWVSAGPESYVPDVFEMITRPGVDLADARSWPPMGKKSLSGYQKKKLFRNHAGMYRDEAPRHGLDSNRDGRGIAVADFDNDGRLDLFVANANAEPYLYRNAMPREPRWIGFVLEGRKSNRDAVGAQLRATAGGRTQLRFVDGGNGFAGQSSRRIHFGLANAATIERLEVRWPSGLRQTFENLQAGRFYRLVEGEPLAKTDSPEPKK